MAAEGDKLAPFVIREVEGLAESARREESRIGSGAYGYVFKINVNGVERIAKKVHGAYVNQVSVAEKQGITSKFRAECIILSKLRHPNVVQFVGVHYGRGGVTDLTLFMECLSSDLDKFLSAHPNLPLSLKLSLLRDISFGLVYLHECEPPIVHRDLTAKNILICDNHCQAKIADLGVAKIVDIQAQLATSHTQTPGQQFYMPPEALEVKASCTPKLDIFSFGHLALYTVNQVLPKVAYSIEHHTDMARQGIVEKMKRKMALDAVGEGHCLNPIISDCLFDNPDQRPTSRDLNHRLCLLVLRNPEESCNKSKCKHKVEQLKRSISEMSLGKLSHMECERQIADYRTQICELDRTNYEFKRARDEAINECAAAHVEAQTYKGDFLLERRDRERARDELERARGDLEISRRETERAREELEGVQEELGRSQGEVTELNKKNTELTAFFHDERKKLHDELDKLLALKKEIEENQANAELVKERDALKRELERLQKDNDTLRQEKTDFQARLSNLASDLAKESDAVKRKPQQPPGQFQNQPYFSLQGGAERPQPPGHDLGGGWQPAEAYHGPTTLPPFHPQDPHPAHPLQDQQYVPRRPHHHNHPSREEFAKRKSRSDDTDYSDHPAPPSYQPQISYPFNEAQAYQANEPQGYPTTGFEMWQQGYHTMGEQSHNTHQQQHGQNPMYQQQRIPIVIPNAQNRQFQSMQYGHHSPPHPPKPPKGAMKTHDNRGLVFKQKAVHFPPSEPQQHQGREASSPTIPHEGMQSMAISSEAGAGIHKAQSIGSKSSKDTPSKKKHTAKRETEKQQDSDSENDNDCLDTGLDTEIHSMAAGVREEVSEENERIVTVEHKPYDPNLVCPKCGKRHRIGEIQKFRKHVKECRSDGEGNSSFV